MITPALTILTGDCREQLRTLPAESVQCCVTSPPYWGLRDYGVEGMIGLEDSFPEWMEKMLAVFAEVHRVLRKDGVLWVNMGDCYVGGGRGPQGATGQRRDRATARSNVQSTGPSRPLSGLKAKDMLGQPWRLAFALQDAGWWLRRDVVWHKPNPMPETVYDRPTTAHEYVFMFTKSAKYFYNWEEAREPATGRAHSRGSGVNAKIKVPDGWDTGAGAHGAFHRDGRSGGKGDGREAQGLKTADRLGRGPGWRARQNASFSGAVNEVVNDRNWRSVWSICTEKFAGAHFATFPTELARRCILAGCPRGGGSARSVWWQRHHRRRGPRAGALGHPLRAQPRLRAPHPPAVREIAPPLGRAHPAGPAA
jgi:DNA modification methylase